MSNNPPRSGTSWRKDYACYLCQVWSSHQTPVLLQNRTGQCQWSCVMYVQFHETFCQEQSRHKFTQTTKNIGLFFMANIQFSFFFVVFQWVFPSFLKLRNQKTNKINFWTNMKILNTLRLATNFMFLHCGSLSFIFFHSNTILKIYLIELAHKRNKQAKYENEI